MCTHFQEYILKQWGANLQMHKNASPLEQVNVSFHRRALFISKCYLHSDDHMLQPKWFGGKNMKLCDLISISILQLHVIILCNACSSLISCVLYTSLTDSACDIHTWGWTYFAWMKVHLARQKGGPRAQLVIRCSAEWAAASYSTLNLFTCELSFSMPVTSPTSTPPESNTLYPCHRPLLHLSHWCIGSLQKVSTLGLLTPGFRDSFAHPTCLPPVVAQHFTPIPLRPRLSSSLIEWKALAVLLWPGLISLAWGSFSCSL